MVQERFFSVKSPEATKLRRRKFQLVRRFGVPENALGGHLSQTRRRCGKPPCHCVEGEGHPVWTLSCSVAGKKRVETMPADLAAELKPLVTQGREVRKAVMEVLAINLRLLHLWRQQQRGCVRQRKRRRTAETKDSGVSGQSGGAVV